MIKPNPQIELHPAYMWICDECGNTNFERCMVRDVVISADDIYDEPDIHDIAIAEVVCGDFDDDDIDSIDVEALVGEMDDDDDCDCEECTGECSITEYTPPKKVTCGHCKAHFEDVVISG